MPLEYALLSDINLENSFFDSLRNYYSGFNDWYQAKSASGEQAYVYIDAQGNIEGFLYLKIEDGPVDDVTPKLPSFRRVKIGTFKVNAHGTRLGERFLKIAFDWAIEHGAQELYVTAFAKHTGLIQLLSRYGFSPKSKKGGEEVFVKTIGIARSDVDEQYPALSTKGGGYILSIYPKFHTSLFPDSHLNYEEQDDFLHDTSSSNAIQKIYICSMDGVQKFKPGDPIFIYRTADAGKSAEYSSVATSVCVFKNYRNLRVRTHKTA